MSDIIKKYFHDTEDNQNTFNSPATAAQIAELASQLGIELPTDYKDFLAFSNGFEGEVNGAIVILDPVEEIVQNTEDNCGELFPWAVYLGTNGNLEMFVLDTRKKPYQFGLLPSIGTADDFIPLGDTFEQFIGRLYNDTAF